MSALHTTFTSIQTCICPQNLMLQDVEQHFGSPLGTEQVPLPVPLVIVIIAYIFYNYSYHTYR